MAHARSEPTYGWGGLLLEDTEAAPMAPRAGRMSLREPSGPPDLVGAPTNSALRPGREAMDGEAVNRLVLPPGGGEATLELLMEQYTLGSAEAFDELYRRTSTRVFGYLLRLTRHRERAEDLLQVTYSKLHRARDSYLLGAPLMPWVLAIARRSFLDERRRASSRSEDLSVDGSLPEPTSNAAPLPTDTVAALERAMDRLPAAYREAIELTKVSGLSVAEAAEVLGTTPQAVKLRVHRGYGLLRKSLDGFSRGSG